jgi:hypothetical protein
MDEGFCCQASQFFTGILGGFQEKLTRRDGKRRVQMPFNGCEYSFLL